MTIKDALYRELKYALAGQDGALFGLVTQDHIKLDMRNSPQSKRVDTDYPWIIFRRITESEDNSITFAKDRFEIELIGLQSSETAGDALLEQIKNVIKDHFKGVHKTIGKFDADGTPNAGAGLKVKCRYFDTVEGFDETLEEKAHIMIFFFTYLR